MAHGHTKEMSEDHTRKRIKGQAKVNVKRDLRPLLKKGNNKKKIPSEYKPRIKIFIRVNLFILHHVNGEI